MNKIIDFFSQKLENMCVEHSAKINHLSSLQLKSVLPSEFETKTNDEKYNFLLENFKNNNPLYKMIKGDLHLLNNKEVRLDDLKSIDLDPRYLESLGLNESQISKHYKFCDDVKVLFDNLKPYLNIDQN